MFQFQDGSIKCMEKNPIFGEIKMFQFQDGSIKWF